MGETISSINAVLNKQNDIIEISGTYNKEVCYENLTLSGHNEEKRDRGKQRLTSPTKLCKHKGL